LSDGWFVQQVGPCDGVDPPGGQQESFTRPLDPLAGIEEFFIEWRIQTTGDRSEMIGVAPASLVAGGSLGISYHFTIARDQVRLIRDNFLPIVFAELQPDAAHTYRVELYGSKSYVWSIDGQVIDFGVPEGPFPVPGSVLQWRSKSWFLSSTTRWDYVRFGRVPEDGSGDYNSNGVVTLDDFYFFHECLTNVRPGIKGGPGQDSGPGCRFADFNADSSTDLSDFAEFQVHFTAGE
jgi:hypothetical protein